MTLVLDLIGTFLNKLNPLAYDINDLVLDLIGTFLNIVFIYSFLTKYEVLIFYHCNF